MPDLSMCLSENFTLGELVKSESAERSPRLKREQENPPQSVIESLRYIANTTLQPIRNKLGFPINITSGYRSPSVNRKVGGSSKSQHLRGEAADCQLSQAFLALTEADAVREEIESGVRKITGKSLRSDVGANFYLFAYVCLHIEELRTDQLIHEYGQSPGHPAWIHISATKRQCRKQILVVGSYTGRRYRKPSLREALACGT